MKAVPAHHTAAGYLAHRVKNPEGGRHLAPVEAGYLAAVERLQDDVWRYVVNWRDTCNDEAQFMAHKRGDVVDLVAVVADDGDEGGTSLDDDGVRFAELELTPAAARERAYELLVLADMAEARARLSRMEEAGHER